MQKPLEEVYGIVPALLIVGTMFWIAHLDHGITVTHLPFQMSASIALGLLAYLTRSLNTSNGRTCRGRRSSCAVLFLSSARICLESIIGAADLGSVASTFSERLLSIFTAMAPQNMFADGPFQGFAVIAWVFLLSGVLTIFAFINMAWVSRSSAA